MKRILVIAVPVALCLMGARATPIHAADVLILEPTVGSPYATSLEYQVVTSVGPVPGNVAVTGLGMTAKVVSAASWPAENYSSYKAIVLGDPLCPGGPAPLAAAAANAGVWAPKITGNVVIIGTDPSIHPGASGVSGAQLWKSAIAFAAAGPGTGAVIALSCYYAASPAGTPVPVLNGFGIFKVEGNVPCAGDVAIVAASPALTGLTGGPGGTLSAWSCSVHEGFSSWDPSFLPLAIATDVPAAMKTYPVSDPKGFPYILARGKDLTLVEGILKVCKVAGLGIAVGTPFTFTAGAGMFTVPAGPPPGGTCVIGPSFAVGSVVTVDENVPPGDIVSSITVEPPGQLVGVPDLVKGTVTVTIGPEVTEVTYTDTKTGYIEICKRGDVKGDFSFVVNPGGLGPFVVPAGACSPAIQVPAGQVVITELPKPGAELVDCSAIPASRQGPCDLATQSSTVTVIPGDVSSQTITILTNRPVHVSGSQAGGDPDHHH